MPTDIDELRKNALPQLESFIETLGLQEVLRLMQAYMLKRATRMREFTGCSGIFAYNTSASTNPWDSAAGLVVTNVLSYGMTEVLKVGDRFKL